jgi:hypothetical protein
LREFPSRGRVDKSTNSCIILTMKQTSIAITEPKITIEFSLSEVKNLVEILGAFSPAEIEKATGGLSGNAPTVQKVYGLFNSLRDIAQNATDQI